jgi:hypothetical protein
MRKDDDAAGGVGGGVRRLLPAVPTHALAADGASCQGQAASEGAQALGGLGGFVRELAAPGIGERVADNARTRGGGHCDFEGQQ